MSFFNDIEKAFKSIPPPKPLPRIPPPKPLPPPISFKEFMGGVQSVTTVATSPARDLIETLAGATKYVTGGITDKISESMGGMMLPLLIGGGVLLIVLIIR